MNWIEEWAKLEIIFKCVGLGLLIIGSVFLVIYRICLVIEEKKIERKKKGK